MPEVEHLTITLPSEMVPAVRGAVVDGDCASSSEVVREAIRDWEAKRALRAKAGRSGGGPGERFRRDAQYRAGEGGFGRPLAIRLTAADEEDLAQISAYIAIEVSETVAAQFVAAFEPVRYADFALCALID